MYGGITFCHSVFWDENICPLFGGVRCIEVSVNGDSTVYDSDEKNRNLKGLFHPAFLARVVSWLAFVCRHFHVQNGF